MVNVEKCHHYCQTCALPCTAPWPPPCCLPPPSHWVPAPWQEGSFPIRPPQGNLACLNSLYSPISHKKCFFPMRSSLCPIAAPMQVTTTASAHQPNAGPGIPGRPNTLYDPQSPPGAPSPDPGEREPLPQGRPSLHGWANQTDSSARPNCTTPATRN